MSQNNVVDPGHILGTIGLLMIFLPVDLNKKNLNYETPKICVNKNGIVYTDLVSLK